MRQRLPRRSRRELDDLLAGNGPAGDPVARLLRAAAAPGRADELAGAPEAVAVFAAASLVPPVEKSIAPRRTAPALARVARRMLALRLLALAAGTAAVGGVAYAAASGPLSTPSAGPASHAPGVDPRTGASIGVPASTRAGPHPAAAASSAAARAHSSVATRGRLAPPPASPSPSLRGLCTAWLAQPSHHARMAADPAFAALVRAAGSAADVSGFCTDLLATAAPPRAQTGRPTRPAPTTDSDEGDEGDEGDASAASNSTHGPPPQSVRSAAVRTATPSR
jgi:hypothetical protein